MGLFLNDERHHQQHGGYDNLRKPILTFLVMVVMLVLVPVFVLVLVFRFVMTVFAVFCFLLMVMRMLFFHNQQLFYCCKGTAFPVQPSCKLFPWHPTR